MIAGPRAVIGCGPAAPAAAPGREPAKATPKKKMAFLPFRPLK